MANQFQSVQGNFKKVYGDLSSLLPLGYKIQEKIKFDKMAKIGESYNIAVVLSREGGVTLAGSAGGVTSLNPATAGAVSQALVRSSEILLPSYIPFSVIARSQGAPESAFIKSTSLIVKNNLQSHQDYMESLLLYGQADAGLGYVSYATATYRGVSLTAGAGTINGVTFATGGVDTTNNYILLAPGQFASGIWVGRVGTPICQVATATNAIVGQGKIVAVNSQYGYIKVDFTPVAASSATSHKLCFPGMESASEFVGINKILSNTGSLFGIDAGAYELWKGTQYAVSSVKLTFSVLQDAMAAAVNQGLDGDVVAYCNPRSFAKLVTDQAALRMYDSSYSKSEMSNGSESLTFWGMAGKMEIVPHRYVKEGECYLLHIEDWMRPGSQDIQMKVNGADGELISLLENQTAYRFMTYSDTAVICSAPAKSVLISGINDESAT